MSADFLCQSIQQVSGGEGQYINCPPVEQWFDVIITFLEQPSSGDITFGAYFNYGGDNFYPVKDKGYLTVGYAVIPQKSGTEPLKAVVSFPGQPTTGALGISNTTDARIQCVVNSAPRTIGDKR